MNPVMKCRNGSYATGLLGVAILAGAQALMYFRVEPFFSWFYSFAWWSYILIADSVVHCLQGRSLIRNRPREFWMLVPWSVTCWLIFELFNLALKNWQYVNVPPEVWLRWPGYALAYSTVLPGIFETFELLNALGLFRKIRPGRLPRGSGWRKPCFVLGLLSTILVVVWPRYCFPLVWAGPTLILEPIVHGLKGDSLVRRWQQEGIRPILNLLCAGAVCGLLWEFWNFWAGAKWKYTVPFVDYWKVFEMPVLGYLGFLPFALECFVMVAAIKLFYTGTPKASREPGRSNVRRVLSASVAALATVLFWVFSFYQIDTHTVVSFGS